MIHIFRTTGQIITKLLHNHLHKYALECGYCAAMLGGCAEQFIWRSRRSHCDECAQPDRDVCVAAGQPPCKLCPSGKTLPAHLCGCCVEPIS